MEKTLLHVCLRRVIDVGPVSRGLPRVVLRSLSVRRKAGTLKVDENERPAYCQIDGFGLDRKRCMLNYPFL